MNICRIIIDEARIRHHPLRGAIRAQAAMIRFRRGFPGRLFRFSRIRSFSASKTDLTGPIAVVSTVASPHERSQHIDAGSSIRKPISLWPGMYHSPVTNALWEARSRIFAKPGDSAAPSQSGGGDELIAWPPSMSRTSVLYKFSEDYILREQYRNPWDEIRMGKLVEDLDALAGTISFKVRF